MNNDVYLSLMKIQGTSVWKYGGLRAEAFSFQTTERRFTDVFHGLISSDSHAEIEGFRWLIHTV